MDREARDESAAVRKGLLHLGDKTLVVRSPGDADFAFLAGELRRLAKLKCKSPLAALAEEFASLPAEMKALAMKEAVALKSGGEVEPTQDQIAAQIYDPEGCRVWVWWLAREDQPGLTLAGVSELINAANVVEVLAELARATGLKRAFPNSSGPTSSSAGSAGAGPSSTADSPRPSTGPRPSAA